MFNLLIISSILILAVKCQRESLIENLKQKASYISSILPDNANGTTQIKIGLSLINIVDFDYERQEIEIRIWLQLGWREERLSWDPKEYGNIESVRLNTRFIPKPDLKLYNGDMKIDDDVLIVVSSDGTITFIPPAHIKAQCPQKQRHPDIITCTFKIGSWVYDGHQLQLKSDQKSADLNDFQPGWRWNLKQATTELKIFHYPCCPEPFRLLNFTLKVQDKSRRGKWW